ncbi:MAG: hypothetical protein GXO83_10525 [Chlorobi bacterium]|nr:hypothetical protein [Chlorobiota bacterium]
MCFNFSEKCLKDHYFLQNPANWLYNNIPTLTLLDRGFTGHEYMDKFGLINMPARRSFSEGGNGRLYDPLLARMLSPDNYVQMPDYTQNCNRYTYCLNNPLMYKDPSGELIVQLLFAFMNAYINGVLANNMEINPKNWDWHSFDTYYSVVSGAISGYTIGNNVDNYFKIKSHAKKLGKFMKKRALNSDVVFVNDKNLQSFAIRNNNNFPLFGQDIMELYGLSYEDFNALNPGTKVVWEKGEWFNVFPPRPSKLPLGWPPEATRVPIGNILGIVTDSPTALQNWFVNVGGGKANRAYFRPNFGIWEWQWSEPNIEKEITIFGGYTRAWIWNDPKTKWRGTYPYKSFFQQKGGIPTFNSILTFLTIIIK